MWSLDLSRSSFLKLLGCRALDGEFEPSMYTESRKKVKRGGLRLLWKDEPPHDLSSLAPLCIVPESELGEFLAWIVTVVPSYSPITAYCRVVGENSIVNVLDEKLRQPSSLGCIYAALCICEVLTYTHGKLGVKELSLIACENTYSFARAQANAKGLSSQLWRLSEKWNLARSLTSQKQTNVDVKEVEQIWRIVDELSSSSSQRFLFEPNQTLDSFHLRQLVDELVDGSFGQLLMDFHSPDMESLTREKRILWFEDALDKLSRQRKSKTNKGIASAYWASLLSPGSFEYADLVAGYLEKFPNLLLWYGFFTGLQANQEFADKNELLGEQHGLGRRIVRDISNLACLSIWDSPRSDISIEELEILRINDALQRDFHTSLASNWCIELAPTVVCRVSTNNGLQENTSSKRDIRDDLAFAKKEIEKAVARLLNVVDRNS